MKIQVTFVSEASADAAPSAPTAQRERVAYLDNLKMMLVAVIIAGHGVAAYGSLESAWPYQDVQETQLAAATNTVFSMVLIPAALFAMGLFFLIAGQVTPGSLARKGAREFVRGRLIRLGVPLIVWTLAIWPASIWIAHLAAGDPRSFWWQVAHGDPFLDTGPMWFVEVLLIYSLVYAGWWGLSRRGAKLEHDEAASNRGAPLAGRKLVVLAVGISAVNVLVRPILPVASGQVGQSHLWQWPQFVALFGLGIAAARRGWFDPAVSDQIRRGCGFAALGSILAFLLVSVLIAALGVDGDVIFDPGIHWPAVALAVVEGPMAVGTSVWLLGQAQRRLNDRPGRLGQAMARSAYGAFLLQGVVLLVLMIALRPVGVSAEVKALMVAGLGVTGSFWLAWLLVTRTIVGRVL